MDFTRIIGLIAAFGLVAAAVLVGGSGPLFINIPALIMTVALPLAAACANHGFNRVLRAVTVRSSSLLDGQKLSRDDITPIKTLIAYVYAGTGTSMIIALIYQLIRMDDPSSIGAALAVSCLAPLYGVLFAEAWLRPAICRIRTTLPDADQAPLTPQPLAERLAPLAGLVFIAYQVAMVFGILVLSFYIIAPHV